jgi:hypothetical protein
MTELVPYLVLLIAAGVVIYFIVRIRKNVEADDSAPMTPNSRRILIGYLLLIGTILVYMLISLNSVDFPETAAVPEAVPLPTPPPAATESPAPIEAASKQPSLYRIFPQVGTTTPPSTWLTLYGKNFNKDSRIRFNGKKSDITPTFIAEDLISTQLDPNHLVSVGAVTVDVVNQDGLVSNAVSVPIKRPIAPLNVFYFWRPWITRDVQLLLIAIFAGAIGSFLHGLKSLTDFIGNRTAIASWFWWYISRPFMGMALALVFYAVLRGGFVIGSPADAKVVNPFGVLAIGALVGMFSDKAAQKLGEVFDVVFKGADPRSGKLDAPVIDRIEPATVLKGETKPVVLKIVGTHLGRVTTVRMNSDERKPDTVSEKEITLKLKPEDFQSIGKIKVTVVDSDGTASPAATLFVSDLAITNADLPEGKVGTDYVGTMTVSGGTQPYKWSLVTPPSWLRVDEKTGDLKGKPATADAKETQQTVKVVDNEGASAAKEFKLKVNA